jgi:hypothetical protein
MGQTFDLSTKEGRIAHVIERSGHTPSSIARLLGCKPAAVYQWLDGSTRNLKEQFLWKLADVTGFEARWISQGEGPARIDWSIKQATTELQAMEPAARYKAVRIIHTFAEPPHEGDNGNGHH